MLHSINNNTDSSLVYAHNAYTVNQTEKKKSRHLEVLDEPVKMETHTTEKLKNELIAPAGDFGGFQHVGTEFRLRGS